ncbi:MAG: ricin-type beta-trefoil lectin domain protein [Roseiarcus sp.]
MPQCGQTGPLGQSLLSTYAKAAASSLNRGASKAELAMRESPMASTLDHGVCFVKCNVAIGYAGFFFSRDFLTGVGASIGLSLAIFFVIHPFAFLDFKSFIRAQFDLVNATGGEPAASAHKAFARWIRSLYSSHALPIVIGGLLIPPGLAVGVVSYVRRRDDRTLLFIVLCMTMIFVGASIIAFNHAHFAVESLSPVYPMGVLVMMAALDWILDSRARWLRLIAAGAACYLIAFSFLINSLDLAQALAARFQDQEPVAYAGEIRGKDDKCLDIPGGVTEDGTALDYRACSGAPGQQWTIKDGLIAGKDGRCIDIPEGNTADGAVLNLWECEDGAEEQQWEMVRGALIGKDGVCIGLAGGRTDDGAPVQVSRCDGGAGQKWKY